MTTPPALAVVFAAALCLALGTLLWLGGEWLLLPVTWRVGALVLGGGKVLYFIQERRHK